MKRRRWIKKSDKHLPLDNIMVEMIETYTITMSSCLTPIRETTSELQS